MFETRGYNSEKSYISVEQKNKLLHFLKQEYGLDVSDYSEASVRRRLAKILNELRLTKVEDYIDLLRGKENAKHLFLERFTVNVTEMFRDPYCYEGLVRHSFPELAKRKHIRIWSAGCSSGEEVLSLAILLKEHHLLDRTEIIATDISQAILRSAREGCYQLRHLNSYADPYRDAGGKGELSDYYDTVNEELGCFAPELLAPISFQQHNMANDPPAGAFDLVVCRNVLIYFNATLQNRCIDRFTQALRPGGDLFIGSKESILFYNQRDRFQELEEDIKLYRKLR